MYALADQVIEVLQGLDLKEEQIALLDRASVSKDVKEYIARRLGVDRGLKEG